MAPEPRWGQALHFLPHLSSDGGSVEDFPAEGGLKKKQVGISLLEQRVRTLVWLLVVVFSEC